MELRHARALAALLCAACFGAGCKRTIQSSTTSPEAPWFADVTTSLGLSFKHDPGITGTYLMPQSIGSGGALLDYDNDGRLDIYLIHNVSTNSRSTNRLFHQEPDGHFRDVSEGSGLDVTCYGMGVAVGDLNNDGLPEVLLTEFGNTRLFANRGSGHFEDVTGQAGIANIGWATAAAFLDYDRDGWLDLVLVNYVDYSPTIKCYDTRGALEYCGPQGIQATSSRLFHNLGPDAQASVRFQDVTVTSLLAQKTGAGLGVLCADFNGDHWPDILIADDGLPNRLFINQRNGTFKEEAVQRGLAYNSFGSSAANMGIAFGDVDGDGLFDLFIPHVSWEQHGLWKQGPAGLFQEKAMDAGLSNLARRGTGFGAVLADFDLDGDLDLAFVNGRIKRGDDPGPYPAELDPHWRPYAQKNQLLANNSQGGFREISDANPALCTRAGVGRGLVCGDIDNDGAPDLLVINTGANVQLLHNVALRRGHWLTIRAIDPNRGGRDAYGAEIFVQAGNSRWQRLIQPSYSFLVSNDPRAHFGLGSHTKVEAIRVVWPDGNEEDFPGGPVDRMITLRKGGR